MTDQTSAESLDEFIRHQRRAVEAATRIALHEIRSLQAQLQRVAEALENDQDVFITDRSFDGRALNEALITRTIRQERTVIDNRR